MTLPPLSTQAWASNRPSSLLATPMRKVAGWPRRASITWATKASVRQVLAQDRRRPARPTARTTSSMEDRSALRNSTGPSATLPTTRRTVLKGSSHTPTLVVASNSAALIRSRRSAAGRRTNLRRRLAPDLNEPLVSQPPQQREQVAIAAPGLALILREENVPAFTHRPRLLYQFPDPSP